MTEAEIGKLITEHHDLAVREFKRMFREMGSLREEVKILRRIVASGAQLEFPWFKLPSVRRKQVEAVIAYLQEHHNREIFTVKRAASDTFQWEEGGYPNAGALACYCYSIKLESWLADG